MANIGLIVGDAAAPDPMDTKLQNVLSVEHSVTMHSDESAIPTNKDAFVIAYTTTQAILDSTGYLSNPEPMLVLNVDYWDNLSMTNIGVSNPGIASQVDLSPHEITNELPDPMQLTTNNQGMWGVSFSNVANGGTIIMSHISVANHALGFAFPSDSTLWSGNTSRSLVGLLGLIGILVNMTADYEQMLRNAVHWLLPNSVFPSRNFPISLPHRIVKRRRLNA